MSGIQACEFTVYWLGLKMTPMQLWNSSPTGELFNVYALFAQAQMVMKEQYT